MEGPNSARPQATAEAVAAGDPTPGEQASGPAGAPANPQAHRGSVSSLVEFPALQDEPTAVRRRFTTQSRGPNQGPRQSMNTDRQSVRAATVGRTSARKSRFTVSGPEDTPMLRTAHEPFVHPGYADLNPEYDQPQNTKPVWSLAKPLPRVVRPGMIPTRQEVIEQSVRPELPAENSQRVGADVDPNELEAGRIEPSLNPTKVRAQVKDARAQREINFLNKLQNGDPTRSRMSRQQSIKRSRTSASTRRRPTWNVEAEPDRMANLYEEDEPDSDGESKLRDRSPSDEAHRPSETAIQDQAYNAETGRPVDDQASVTTVEDNYGDEKFPDPGDVEPLLEDMMEDELVNNHTTWSVWRTEYREALAELLGVIVQLTIGYAADLGVTIAGAGGTQMNTNWAWGLSTMSGIYVAGGISGAHFNPVVTMVLWFYRGFPKRKMPEYFAAQFLGAFISAFVAYGMYYASIQAYLANPANDVSGIVNSFVTNQRYTYIDVATALFNEFIGTAFLIILILALGDDQNAPPGAGMNAFIVGLVITVLCDAFAYQTGAALNPSRDFGPRLALLALGYGSDLFTNLYWLYGPFAGTLLGGFLGAFLYDFAIFTGGESPINYPWGRTKRAVLKSRQKWKGRLHLIKKPKQEEDKGVR